MQVALVRGGARGTTRCGGRAVIAGGDGLKDRVETLDDVTFAPDHEAVAALEAPDTAAGATVDVVDAFGREDSRAVDVVLVVGVATVDDDVVLL